jgi:hypothetical protein
MSVTELQPAVSHAQPAQASPAYDPAATRKLGALRSLGRQLDPKDPRLAREAAALLTSQLFFAPLLAEMRKLPFGKAFGYGGRMEDAFGEQLDLQIADTVARQDRGFVQRLAEQLSEKPQAASAADPTSPQASWPAQLQARTVIGPGED